MGKCNLQISLKTISLIHIREQIFYNLYTELVHWGCFIISKRIGIAAFKILRKRNIELFFYSKFSQNNYPILFLSEIKIFKYLVIN